MKRNEHLLATTLTSQTELKLYQVVKYEKTGGLSMKNTIG